jgi:23S rRNA pseudouridine955/2504/2580 synthase
MPELKVGADADGWRLDRFVRERLPGMPLSHIFKLFRMGKVRLDGKKAAQAARISEGQAVIVHVPQENFESASKVDHQPRSMGRAVPPFPMEVIFEDSDIVAINKPAGVPVHPGSGYASGTCIERIHEYLGHERSEGVFSPALVHRLDIDTSGVLLAAKTYKALRALAKVFEQRRVTKTYLALVTGELADDEGTIDMLVHRLDHPERDRVAREGVTKYSVLARSVIMAPQKGATRLVELPVTLLKLNIETGRTHQIRSHLKEINAPIIGDPLYGDQEINRQVKEATGLKRQFLHAYELIFKHPADGRLVTLKAPLPPELEAVVKASDLSDKIP